MDDALARRLAALALCAGVVVAVLTGQWRWFAVGLAVVFCLALAADDPKEKDAWQDSDR